MNFILVVRTGSQTSKGRLFHLPHYFEERVTTAQKTLYNLLKHLKENNGQIPYDSMKELIGMDYKRALRHTDWQKYVDSNRALPYKDIYPDSNPKDWKAKNGNMKMVRMVQLRDLDINIEDVWIDKKDDDELMDDLDDDQEDFDDSNRIQSNYDRSMNFLAYQVIDDAGPNGISAIELSKKLGIDKYSTRAVIKNIDRRKIVDTYMKDDGRQKTSHYVAERYQNDTAKVSFISKQVRKLFRLFYQPLIFICTFFKLNLYGTKSIHS